MCFLKRYKYLVLGRDKSYFDSTKKFSETDIIKMLEFFIDNMFAMFDGRVFQQPLGIPLGTNCFPLLADLVFLFVGADFIQGLLKKIEKKLARSFNFRPCYIDDVLSLNNYRLCDFVDRIYTIELGIDRNDRIIVRTKKSLKIPKG